MIGRSGPVLKGQCIVTSTSWARTVVVGSGLHRACQAEDGPGGLRRVGPVSSPTVLSRPPGL